MLRYTKVNIGSITDLDRHQMVEIRIRGRMCQINHRYSKANLPSLTSYNSSLLTKTLYQDKHLIFLGNVSVSTSEELSRGFNWCGLYVPADSSIGDILDVDLEYPEFFDDTHNRYPLAPEYLKITKNMLSPYQQNNFPQSGSVKKKSKLGQQRKAFCALSKFAAISKWGWKLPVYIDLSSLSKHPTWNRT